MMPRPLRLRLAPSVRLCRWCTRRLDYQQDLATKLRLSFFGELACCAPLRRLADAHAPST